MKTQKTILLFVLSLFVAYGTFAATITVPGDYTTIQEAINAATSGDVIQVGDGTYTENPTINKSLTLQSVNLLGATIAGNLSVYNDGDNTTIDGFNFTPTSGTAIAVWWAGNVTISNNYFVGNSGAVDGITFSHSSSPVITGGTISDNEFVDCDFAINMDHDGVYDFSVTGNTIDNARKGIGFGSLCGGTIDDNTVTNCSSMGVEIFKADVTTLSDNTFTGNAVAVSNGDATNTLDASPNWWGDTDPTDDVSGDVTVYPCYADASKTTLFAPVHNTTQNLYYENIQPAINDADPGDVIQVAAGTYDENVSITKVITLTGAGIDVSYIQPSSGEYAVNIGENGDTDAYPGLIIEDFTIVAAPDPEDMDGIRLNSQGSSSNHIIIRYCKFTGEIEKSKAIESPSYGGIGYVTIDYCIFNNVKYGVWMNSFQHGIIQNCTVANTKYDGFAFDTSDLTRLSDIQILNNSFDGCGATGDPSYPGYRATLRFSDTVTDLVVTGNTIQNIASYAIYMAERSSATPAADDVQIEENVIYASASLPGFINDIASSPEFDISPNYWGSASPDFDNVVQGAGNYCPFYSDAGLTTLDYSCFPVHNVTKDTWHGTIQDGINNADPGNVLEAAAMTFSERVTFTKSIDLRGAQYGVDPTAAGARVDPSAESIIDITGLSVTNPNVAVEMSSGVTNISIDGFTIIGSPTSHYADEAVIRAWDDNLTIQNNIIDGYFGIVYKGNDHCAISQNRMTVNKVGVTVQPNPATDLTIADNVIEAGSSPAGDAAAIYLTGCSNVSIAGNTANNFSNGNGVGGSNLSQLTISENTFSGNKKAVNIWGNTTFITISENVLTNSVEHGISIKGQDITISNNVITGSGDCGVNIDRHVIDTERVTILHNDLSGSTNYGVQVNTSAVTELVDASGNWWGSYASGDVSFSANGGSGVDYTPWLKYSTDTSGDIGFQPDLSYLYVDDNSPQAVSTGRIQEGAEMVSGSTVDVLPGTYNETLTFGASYSTANVTIQGNASSRPVITGGVLFQNTGAINNLSLKNLELRGDAGSNKIIKMDAVSGSVNDFSMDNCVLDGENVSGRIGLYGNKLGQSFSITNSEFKNILGFAVMDMDGSSDYSPYGGNGLPLTTVTFANNSVHDCNGSVSLRGHTPTRTTTVNVYANTITNLGNNAGEQGAQWAAIEVNHAEQANIYENVISDVDEGIYGEGQAFQLWDIGVIDFHDNSITDCFQGIFFFGGSAGGSYGGPWPLPTGSMQYNLISGSTQYGMKLDATTTGGPIDAEYNWWGNATGPYDPVGSDEAEPGTCYDPATMKNDNGTGDDVGENIDYCPWLSGNIVWDPDPATITTLGGIVTVDCKYLGGASAGIYGYDIDFTFNPKIANAEHTTVTRGDLFPAGTGESTFLVVDDDGDPVKTISVNSSLLGDQEGKTGPGTLFSVQFTATGSGYTDLEFVTIQARDKDNGDITGLYGDDGRIIVDTMAPVVNSVAIENVTLTYTDDFIKNGDDARVTATITEDGVLTAADITADLSPFGGGTEVNPDNLSNVGTIWTAVWDVCADVNDVVCNPADGTLTITVTVEDMGGNTASGSDNITADNTLPGKVTGLTANCGHQEVHLEWSGFSDANPRGVIIRYRAWGDYPKYDAAAPAYPADSLDGDGSVSAHHIQPATITTYDHAIVPRDIYYYTAFGVDMAGNIGTAADADSRDRSTNYYLADLGSGSGPIPGAGYDGLVHFHDLSFFSGLYWKSDAELSGTEFEANFGPTVANKTYGDRHRLAIPNPNGDNEIGFEDLMILSMNYNRVAPKSGSDGKGRIEDHFALELKGSVVEKEGDDELIVTLYLANDGRQVKGASVKLTFDKNCLSLNSVGKGRLFGTSEQTAFFQSRSAEEWLQVDGSILGQGTAVDYSGELATIRFTILDPKDAQIRFESFKLRDGDNQRLTAQVSDMAVEDVILPEVFDMAQNYPNPFNPETTIKYQLPEPCHVELIIYNARGQKVRTLVNELREAGRYEAVWNGVDDSEQPVSSGMYYYRINAGDYKKLLKMVFLK